MTMTEFLLPFPDHLHDMIVKAIVRFANEDNCTVAEWAGRAVRNVAVQRLSGEAATDGYNTLSAERRPPPLFSPDEWGLPVPTEAWWNGPGLAPGPGEPGDASDAT